MLLKRLLHFAQDKCKRVRWLTLNLLPLVQLYVPVSNALGLGSSFRELEELGYKTIFPQTYSNMALWHRDVRTTRFSVSALQRDFAWTCCALARVDSNFSSWEIGLVTISLGL